MLHQPEHNIKIVNCTISYPVMPCITFMSRCSIRFEWMCASACPQRHVTTNITNYNK